jgi:HD-like signal output (HDOD) protein
MPEMDGLTFLRRVSGGDLDSAVIVMSGAGTMEDVVDVLRGGAVDYIKKPWSMSELLGAVSRAMEIHEKRRQTRTRLSAAPPAAAPAPPPAASKPLDEFRDILERIRRGEYQLPSVPTVISELRNIVQRPDTPIEDVVALVERDQHLASAVLRLSNSVLHRGFSRNNDLRSAVARVGFREVHAMVETIIIHRFFEVQNRELQETMRQLWRQSLGRAVVMRALADLSVTVAAVDGDTAYVAGLLVDVGASLLLKVMADLSASGARALPSEEQCLSLLRLHHEAVGSSILAAWDLDPMIVRLASHHHTDAPPAPPDPLWNILVLGTKICGELLHGEPDITGSTARPAALVERCAVELRIGESLLRKVRERLGVELHTMLQFFAS